MPGQELVVWLGLLNLPHGIFIDQETWQRNRALAKRFADSKMLVHLHGLFAASALVHLELPSRFPTQLNNTLTLGALGPPEQTNGEGMQHTSGCFAMSVFLRVRHPNTPASSHG